MTLPTVSHESNPYERITTLESEVTPENKPHDFDRPVSQPVDHCLPSHPSPSSCKSKVIFEWGEAQENQLFGRDAFGRYKPFIQPSYPDFPPHPSSYSQYLDTKQARPTLNQRKVKAINTLKGMLAAFKHKLDFWEETLIARDDPNIRQALVPKDFFKSSNFGIIVLFNRLIALTERYFTPRNPVSWKQYPKYLIDFIMTPWRRLENAAYGNSLEALKMKGNIEDMHHACRRFYTELYKWNSTLNRCVTCSTKLAVTRYWAAMESNNLTEQLDSLKKMSILYGLDWQFNKLLKEQITDQKFLDGVRWAIQNVLQPKNIFLFGPHAVPDNRAKAYSWIKIRLLSTHPDKISQERRAQETDSDKETSKELFDIIRLIQAMVKHERIGAALFDSNYAYQPLVDVEPNEPSNW